MADAAVARLPGAIVLGVFTAIAVSGGAAPACYPRNCDASLDFWGDDPGEGQMVNDLTWQSNPLEGGWLPLPGNRTWVFKPPIVQSGRVRHREIYVSGSEAPLDAGANFISGAGNIASIVQFPNGEFWVQNNTCAHYFLRVQFEIVADDGDGGSGDADSGEAGDGGSVPDAGISDASVR